MKKTENEKLLEKACDQKLDELAEKLMSTDADDEKLKILAENADCLRKIKAENPKGFKAWLKQLSAKDVLQMSFSLLMFLMLLFGEKAGHFISSKAQNFIFWNRAH